MTCFSLGRHGDLRCDSGSDFDCPDAEWWSRHYCLCDKRHRSFNRSPPHSDEEDSDTDNSLEGSVFVDPDADMEEIGLATTTTSPDDPMDMDEGRPVGCGSADDPIIIDSDSDVPAIVPNGVHVVGDGSSDYPIEVDSEGLDENDVFMPSTLEFSHCPLRSGGPSEDTDSGGGGISSPNGCAKTCFQRQLLFGRKRKVGASHSKMDGKSWRTSNFSHDCAVGKCLPGLSL